jgi:hypothetical protein
MTLKSLLTSFLQQTGGLEFTKGGGARTGQAPSTSITSAQQKILTDNLINQSQRNSLLIYAMLLMLLVLFGVCIYFAILYKDDPRNLKLTIGGSLIGLLVIVKLLFSIWNEKAKMDLLVTLVLSSSPEQAKELVETIYYRGKSKS